MPWQMRREDVPPGPCCTRPTTSPAGLWRTRFGKKYLPSCYLDRPRLSEPLRQFVAAPGTPPARFCCRGARAAARRPCCATSWNCWPTHARDHAESREPAQDGPVFFLRGDGIIAELDGGNLLLANLLHKMGVKQGAFASFGEFFAHLASQRVKDHVAGRRMVLVLDALNEAPQSSRILQEALEMVAAAREHVWLRIALSARSEFLDVWRGLGESTVPSPFHAVRPLFVTPPDDPLNPLAPEDPPAWVVPGFTKDEAATVYENYQTAHRASGAVPACNTVWPRIAPTAQTLLTTPLYLDLWMTTFNAKDALPVSGELELFDAYFADLRERFDNFWPDMQIILRYLLERGQVDLTDGDANEIHEAWDAARTTEQRRLHLPPVESVCVAGVMQKRVTEEDGGYRIPFQRLREVLFYQSMKGRDPSLKPSSLRAWLSYPPTDDLEGALSQIAQDLWKADRSAELVVYVEDQGLGHRALSRMLARRLERREETLLFKRGLNRLLDSVPDDDDVAYVLGNLLVFDVPGRIAGLSLTEVSTVFFTCAARWMEARRFGTLGQSWQRTLSVSYNKSGDLSVRFGNGEEARKWFAKGLSIAERLYSADPGNAGFARDLSISYERLGDMARDAGDSGAALGWFKRAKDIRQRLYSADPGNADFARDLSVSYNKLGDLSVRSGNGEEARKWFAKQLSIAERLYSADPGNAGFARDLSVSYNKLGDLSVRSGNGEEAREWFNKSREIRERLYSADPGNAGFARDLSVSYNKLGDLSVRSGNGEEARGWFAKGLSIAERLYSADPGNADFARDLSVSYNKLGDLSVRFGNGEEAREWFNKIAGNP